MGPIELIILFGIMARAMNRATTGRAPTPRRAAADAQDASTRRAAFDARMDEGRMLHTAGRHEEALVAFRAAEQAARRLGRAQRDEARRWRAQARAARNRTVAPPVGERAKDAAPAPPPPPPPPPPGPNAAELFATLYAAAGVVDVGARFEAEYRDKVVHWTGVLRSVEGVMLDYVLGDGPLTRAVVAVHAPGGDGLDLGALQAVVRLPADDAARLAGAIGVTVSFTGRLVACDPFSRNVYVAEGALAGA